MSALFLLAGHAGAAAPPTPSSADPPSPDRSPRNVILISVDTLRADALGFAGNTAVATPTLDRLAASGRVFERAHAHNVVTLPSHANMLTGRLPYEHGVRDNAGFTLDDDIPTLATRLDDAGFATAAFVGAFPLDARFGLSRGFDRYDDDYDVAAGDQVAGFSERPGDEVVDRALAWWRQHAGERKFLFVHLFDPHAPYQPPEPFASRYADRPYLGEVAATDAHLTPLLEPLLADDSEPTLVIFTSDHGEGLGEHGEDTHGLFAYEGTLRVPLVLWGPGVERGRDRRSVGHIDLVPTVLDALGMAVPADLAGRSLLRPEPAADERALYFEALSANLDFGWAPLRGTIVGDDKLIVLPLPELYDLSADPGESENLFAEDRRTARKLADALPAESSWPPRRGTVRTEDAARLRSLGYSVGSTTSTQRFTAADDPKNLIALDRKIRRVAALRLDGRFDDAIAVLRSVLEERPTMRLVYEQLADLLLRQNRGEEALAVMQEARRRQLADRHLLRQLGLTLAEAGRAAEALTVLEPLAAQQRDAETLIVVGLALGRLGRLDAAATTLDEVLRDAPDHAHALETAAFIATEQGRFADAAGHARRATELAPERADAWNNLGVALFHLGQPVEAAHAWQRALEVEPGNLDPLFNLAVAAAEAGSEAAAKRALEHFLDLAPAGRYRTQRRTAEQLLHQLDG